MLRVIHNWLRQLHTLVQGWVLIPGRYQPAYQVVRVRPQPTQPARRHLASRGISLVELAIAMAIISILAAYTVNALDGYIESSDARMVEETQATLQSIISQAASRLDVRPTDLQNGVTIGGNTFSPTNVVNAASVNMNGVGTLAVSGTQYVLTLRDNKRSARYAVAGNGDVRLVTIAGFSRYTISPTLYTIIHN